jgi:hypothetical protein
MYEGVEDTRREWMYYYRVGIYILGWRLDICFGYSFLFV